MFLQCWSDYNIITGQQQPKYWIGFFFFFAVFYRFLLTENRWKSKILSHNFFFFTIFIYIYIYNRRSKTCGFSGVRNTSNIHVPINVLLRNCKKIICLVISFFHCCYEFFIIIINFYYFIEKKNCTWWWEMKVVFGFSTLENIEFTKNIPYRWKKKLFSQTNMIIRIIMIDEHNF